MAEEIDQELGAAAGGDSSAAVSLALSAAAQNERVAAKAEVFLEEQTRLAREQVELSRLQAEDLRREDRLRHWSLRVRHLSDLLKLTFEFSVAVLGFGALVAAVAAIWIAAHEDSVVIEPFAVPPSFVTRGLTGEVLANRLLDEIKGLEASIAVPDVKPTFESTLADVRVQIPSTGVSISELYRYLVSWFGHETPISGDVVETQSGLATTIRFGGLVINLTDSGEDFSKTIHNAAEAVVEARQPLAYSITQQMLGNTTKAMQVVQRVAEDPHNLPVERAWAYSAWAGQLIGRGQFKEAMDNARLSLTLLEENTLANQMISEADQLLGHDEAALLPLGRAYRYAQQGDASGLGPEFATFNLEITQQALLEEQGSYREAVEFTQKEPSHADDPQWESNELIVDVARDMALSHDIAKSRQEMLRHHFADDVSALAPSMLQQFPGFAYFSGYIVLEDWSEGLADIVRLDGAAALPNSGAEGLHATLFAPWIAYLKARLGNVRGAQELISTTPLDCYLCIRMRGNIAAVAGNRTMADAWFTEAVRQAPSVPFAYTDWGSVLLHRGEYDAAIAKFALANQRGPHFADPLEMWGEALMLKNRSDLALAKFEDANKYAPSWGRLHMKWGEALGYVGRKDEARAQYRIASALDLSQRDRTELARDLRS